MRMKSAHDCAGSDSGRDLVTFLFAKSDEGKARAIGWLRWFVVMDTEVAVP